MEHRRSHFLFPYGDFTSHLGESLLSEVVEISVFWLLQLPLIMV